MSDDLFFPLPSGGGEGPSVWMMSACWLAAFCSEKEAHREREGWGEGKGERGKGRKKKRCSAAWERGDESSRSEEDVQGTKS